MQIPKGFGLVICFLAASITNSIKAQNVNSFQQEMEAWKQKRIAALKAPNGWVNLTGLYWLNPGKNNFGSDASNEMVYKHPNMPKHAGYFVYENSRVYWVTADGVPVTINDSSITKALVFEEGKNEAPLLALGTLRWNIIQREDKIGVRLRDLASVAVKHFKGTERFKDDSAWRLNAHLETVSDNRLFITNVLGQTNAQPSPGKLVFTIGGKEYKLAAMEEGDQLFIIFGDATSGKTTYPAGRFLYAAKPGADGNTIIDFNKAFNPPCAFTKFATCPLPPKQNFLPIAITAGEKNYHTAAGHSLNK